MTVFSTPSTSQQNNHTGVVTQLGEAFTANLLKALGLSPTIITSCVCTSLVSSIVSLISSTYLISTCNNGRYFVYSIPLVASLTSICSQLAILVHTYTKLEFDFQKVYALINRVIDAHTQRHTKYSQHPAQTTSNALDYGFIIKYIIKIVVMLITTGLSKIGWSIADINGILTFNDKTTKLSNDAITFVNDMLLEVGLTDFLGKETTFKHYQSLVVETQQLMIQNPGDFVTDTISYSTLASKIKEVNDILIAPLTVDESRQYQAIRTVLRSNQQKLLEIKSSVDSILSGKNRVAAYGMLFEGTPGIGKSELAVYVMNKIAKKMNFNPSIYDFKQTSSEKFTRPYGNEVFGIYNEFANSTGVDTQIKALNSVISSDPFSFESAFVKEQPCKLRVVSLTSNQTEYSNLLKTIPEPTLCALFSRLIRVRVTDEQFRGRFNPNNHRQSDFSHLKLEILTPRSQQPTSINHLNELNTVETTVDDLIDLMVKQACVAEIFYWNKAIESLLEDDIRIPAMRNRISFCQGMHDGIAGATSSNAEGNYCVVRLQGGVGCFKSTTSKESANRLAALYNLPIRNIKYAHQLQDSNVHGPSIYIFDDFNFEESAQEYMNFVNCMDTNSIVIIATNHVVRYEPISRFSYFHMNNAWHSAFTGLKWTQMLNFKSCNFLPLMLLQFFMFLFFVSPTSAYQPTNDTLQIPINKVPGIVRRVGFSDRVLDNGVVTNMPKPAGLCFTVSPGGSYDTPDRTYYADDVPDVILNHYSSFITSHKITPVVNSTPPTFSPDVTIEIKDFELWKEQVKTANGYAQMFISNNHPAGRVTVKPGFELKFLQQAQLSYWIIPDLRQKSEIRPIVRTLCNTLRNAIPGITAVVTSSDFCYSYVNNIIYESQTYHIDIPIKVENNVVSYAGRTVPALEIFQFLRNPQLISQLTELHKFSGSELAHIAFWFKTQQNWKHVEVYNTANNLVEHAVQRQRNVVKHPILTWLKSHKIACSVIGVILTTFTTWIAVKGLYKWLTAKSSSTSNTTAEYDKMQERYVEAIHKGQVNNPNEYAEVMRKAGVNNEQIEGWQDYNTMLRQGYFDDESNSTVTSESNNYPKSYAGSQQMLSSIARLVTANDTKAANLLLQKFNENHKLTLGHIKQLTHVDSNAVPPSQEISMHNPVITTFTQQLRKACLRVTNSTRGGTCYGLIVKENYFVTVSHLFDRGDTVYVSWTLGTNDSPRQWAANVLYVNRELDLAVCEVTDRNFPHGHNIVKHMLNTSTPNPQVGTAYYIRPFQNGFVYAGNAVRHEFNNITRVDHNNPRYSPRDYYTYTWTQLLETEDIFSKGDCGLPLVCVIGGKAIIMGIHNGFSQHSVAFFSPLDRRAIESLLNCKPITIANSSEPSLLYTHKVVLDLPQYNDAIQKNDIGKETHWDKYKDDMNIIGHSQNLYFFSNPSFKKKNYHNSDCILPNRSLPSAFERKSLSQTALSVLPKNKNGKASPLVAQALKFGDKTSTNYDPEVLEQAFRIQCNLYKSVLPPGSILRPAAALNGIMGENLKPIVLHTSPGPDVKRVFKIGTKEPLVRNVNEEDPTKPPWFVWTDHPAAIKVQADTAAIFEQWCGGVQTSVISKDNPKVELLPLEKVQDEGKVRLFCEVDMAVNLVLRRLMGSFISACNESHQFLNLKTGINPYRDLHWAAKSFDKKGKVFGFDVKRMDKYLPAELVHKVFMLIEHCLEDTKRDGTTKILYETAARSVTDRVHILEGLLYSVKRGNPSGLTGTNHINALALELIIIYGYIERQKLLNPVSFTPTNCDYMANIRGFINGDNGYLVVPEWMGYTEDTIHIMFGKFGMEVLFDKSSLQGIEWCGREIKTCDGFLFPALRQEAITRQIWWVNPNKLLEYPLQAVLIQFEASLHDRKFFNDVQHDIRVIAKTLSMDPSKIVYIDFDAQRYHFKRYIAGVEASPVLTGQVPTCLRILNVTKNSNLKFIMDTVNWIGRYNERCQKDKLPTSPNERYKQDTSTLTWFATVEDQGYVGEGSGDRKSIAKNQAFSILYENRFGTSVETTSNADRKLHKHNIRYTCDSSGTPGANLVRIYADDKMVLEIKTPMSREMVSSTVKSHLRDTEAWEGAFYAATQAFAGSCSGSSNGDNQNLNKSAIAPVVPQGSCMPAQNSSQPTSTAGQVEPPSVPLLAAGGIAKMTVLNPYGPLNRMTEGGVTVDLPTLIYSQMIDGNQTFHVTDSMPAGTIITQIPWDPTSDFVNKYIRAYARQHGRANGSLKFRITMVSNQTFSGGVIVFWSPEKYKGETIDRAEAQKYSYTVLTTTMPAAENFILNDARQYEYYRKIPVTDTDSVPHLVIAVHLPLRSPLKEGVSCDIVIGSQLCGPMDQKLYMAQPFEFAEPLVQDIGPSPSGNSINGLTIGQIFPSYSIKRLNMALDGRSYLPSLSTILNGEEMFFDFRTMLPCLAGGTFPDNLTRRLVSSHVSTSTIGDNEVRQVFVIMRCTPNEEQSIAQDPDFIDTAKGDEWLTKAKNMSWLRSVVPVNVARTNSTALNLYTKDSTKLDLVQQTSFVGLHGQGYVQCYRYTCKHNTLEALMSCGLPNQSQPNKTILPHNPVLGPMDTSDGLITLPAAWASLVLTSQPLGTVTGNNELAPTTVSDPVFPKFFQERSEALTNIECLQFKLLEPTTQTVIAIVRYLHTSQIFAVRPVDGINYRLYQDNANNLLFDEFGVVRTTSGFSGTDTTGWLSRFPSAFFNGRAITTSNAALFVPEIIAEMDGAMAELGDAITGSSEVGGEAAEIESSIVPRVRPNTNHESTQNFSENSEFDGPSYTSNTQNNFQYNNFQNQYFKFGGFGNQNDQFKHWMLYGVMPPLIASNFSNGNAFTGPAKLVNDVIQADKNRDFTSRQNDLQRQHEMVMQDNQNSFLNQEQANAFAHDSQLEQQREAFAHTENQANFDFQRGQQQGLFQHQDTMQDKEFTHQTEMEGTQFVHGLINTATGGAFGIANTVIGRAGDALLENQRFSDQSKLMAQNANLHIQEAGQTSQSMQIAGAK